MIEVIGFDLDDTLWEVAPVIIRAEQTLNDWLQTAAPGLKYDVVSMRSLRDEVLGRNPELRKQITELRRQIILCALEKSRVSESARLADEAIEVFLHARNQIELFEGALDVLDHLDSDHRLGALSNGNADVHRLGLSHIFDFAFSAEDVGAPKPDLALFEHALRHTGVSASQMVYVGDDPILDVDAAKQAGLMTVWLDHGKKPQGATRPDATISHIRELPDAIRSLGQHI